MRKYQTFVVMMILVLTICCAVFTYLNSNYYYSKKLVSAIKEENIVAVQQIIEKKPSCVNTYPTFAPVWLQSLIDISIEYPLAEACLAGNIEIVEIIVENGADVNLGSVVTPLSLTYYQKPHNWYSISLFLQKSGASLDYKSPHPGGNVLTDIVMSRPGIMTVAYGRESNDEVNKAFNYALENCDHSKINWMRVLQHSVTNDRIEIVKHLLDGGYCDVNDTSVGMTALMFAARDSTPEMMRLLLDSGADKSIKTSDGESALDYAKETGNPELIALLSATETVGSFSLSEFESELLEFPREEIVGRIDTPRQAREMAEAIFLRVYGEECVEGEKPYHVAYDEENRVWYVCGSFPEDSLAFGGVANLLVEKDSGKVLAVWHTK